MNTTPHPLSSADPALIDPQRRSARFSDAATARTERYAALLLDVAERGATIARALERQIIASEQPEPTAQTIVAARDLGRVFAQVGRVVGQMAALDAKLMADRRKAESSDQAERARREDEQLTAARSVKKARAIRIVQTVLATTAKSDPFGSRVLTKSLLERVRAKDFDAVLDEPAILKIVLGLWRDIGFVPDLGDLAEAEAIVALEDATIDAFVAKAGLDEDEIPDEAAIEPALAARERGPP